MHRSRKISNRNSIQFCRYRCLKVAYGCILVSLQLHFQLQKCKIIEQTRIRRVCRMVKSFVSTTPCSHCCAINTLFPLFCCQRMRHKLCTQFSFFQIIRQIVVNNGFWYPVLSTIILQQARWSSFKTAAIWAMFSFIFIVPGLLLRSASAIDSSPTANWWQNALILSHIDGLTSNLVCRRSRVF